MLWLNAALAFAITMLILSMVTSVFVETIHRLWGLRERGLYLMLGHFFDRIVAPYIKTRGLNPDGLKKEFIDLMTVNRSPSGVAGSEKLDAALTKDLSSNSDDLDKKLYSKRWSGRRLSKLDVNEFMSRLGGSATFGGIVRDAIIQSGLPDPELALHDIATKFEAFGDEASVFFQRRARLVSVAAALVVSVSIYVHPYELFNSYLTNPDTALAIIARQDEVMKQYSTTVAAEASGQSPNSVIEKQVVDELKASLENAKTAAADATKTLQDAGAPVGWTNGRWEEFWRAMSDPNASKADWGQSLQTLFWLVIGGLLVGLGGPFWYDMVKSLTNIRSLFGGATSTAGTSAQTAGDGSGPSTPPQTPVEHFNAAAAGRDATSGINQSDDEAPVG